MRSSLSFEELQGWLSFYEGVVYSRQQAGHEAYEKPLLMRDDLGTGWHK